MAAAANRIVFRGDEIGDWTEVKLDISKKYAVAYSKILAAQPHLHHDSVGRVIRYSSSHSAM